jgi:hypothetical protein
MSKHTPPIVARLRGERWGSGDLGEQAAETIMALLEALEALVNGPGEGRVSPSEPDSYERRMAQARAAIAKARGQS